MEKQVLILDQKQIDRKLQRMAFEIWEQNSSEQEITLIGIEGAGKDFKWKLPSSAVSIPKGIIESLL